MIFWLILALMTFLATLSVVIPLSRGTGNGRSRLEFDKAVYKARLEEIGRDRELGRISPEAADAALAEEGRKLIALANAAPSSSVDNKTGFNTSRYWLLAATTVLVLPIMTLATYFFLGNPELPDQSLASRLTVDPATQSIEELVARAESHLAANPADVRGWSVLAPVYARMGRISEATHAWQTVFRLKPDFPQIRSTLAESMVELADGVVTGEAHKLFADELALDPGSTKAKFYLAMAMGQQGDHANAVTAWNELISTGTPDAPWMEAALQFRDASMKAGNITNTDVAPGPSQTDIDAASQMSETDRNAMIRTMVAGLAEKLKETPNDKAGWQRLVRSYIVLGETDKANEAIDSALSQNPQDVEFAAKMNAFKENIGK
jgi:cytochrome c-type biogenesis protein CcmH